MHKAFFAWGSLAIEATRLAMDSAQVVAHRTGAMSDRRELALMGSEKAEAAVASAQAMAIPMLALNQQLAMLGYKQMLTAWTAMFSVPTSRSASKFVTDSIANSVAAAPRLSAASVRVARSGMKPVARRAGANAARLNRKKK